ncbi:MAG: hypothetical protein RJB13_1868 [Pseudomonadota bacterium]|jgi:hypothetical protein
MRFWFYLKTLLFIFAGSISSCQTLSDEQKYSEAQTLNNDRVKSQFEATELSRCIDSNGEKGGTINIIWKTRESEKDISAPFITGFSGNLFSLNGKKVEFQSLTASQLTNFTIPPVTNRKLFPYGSYSGFTLHFPFDEQANGWAFLKLDGQHIKPTAVTGAELLIPKYVIGGQYSTRFYLRIDGGSFHEFSCQPISNELRQRLGTFQKRGGEHSNKISRGRKVALNVPEPKPSSQMPPLHKVDKVGKSAAANELLEVILEPKESDRTAKSEIRNSVDLRPIGRPKSYDSTYQHVRIYECGEFGSIDAIWSVRTNDGRVLNKESRFITGFAADIKDMQKKSAFYFSTVEIDSEPAFYSGTMPSGGSYYFPTLKFSADSLEKNESAHSKIMVLKKGERVAAATIYLPRSGLGEQVSVSLALGKSLRGTPYQATVNCRAASPKLKYWFKNCLGKNSTGLENRSCNL